MPTVKSVIAQTRLESGLAIRLDAVAKERNVTQSKLLRQLISELVNVAPADQVAVAIPPPQPAFDAALDTTSRRMTLRMPEFLWAEVRAQARAMDMAPTRWIAALVQSRLTATPVMTSIELRVLRETNRSIDSVGRNVNQIARALNAADGEFAERSMAKLVFLRELSTALQVNREAIQDLIRASKLGWGSEQ